MKGNTNYIESFLKGIVALVFWFFGVMHSHDLVFGFQND